VVESKIINISEHGLKERERLTSELVVDKEQPHVLLATCNRTELYWGDGEVPMSLVEHLFRVASGLESSLIGERAIQGQIKQAYQEALEKYSLPKGLNRLFQYAMHTGKRARMETKISEGAVSHSQVAVDILKDRAVDIANSNITVVGVNKLNEDILKFLYARGAKNVVVANRHVEKAETFAKPYGYGFTGITHDRELLANTDVLISATSASHAIFFKDDFPLDREMLVIDLAFPRDVEEGTEQLDNVTLFNIEDIESFARKNLQNRHEEVAKVEAIIKEEMDTFEEWQKKAFAINE